MDHAKNIRSTEETKRVLQALSANNYPTHFLRGHQSNAERETNVSVTDRRRLVILPYAKGCSEMIAKVLKDFNIKLSSAPSQIFGRT